MVLADARSATTAGRARRTPSDFTSHGDRNGNPQLGRRNHLEPTARTLRGRRSWPEHACAVRVAGRRRSNAVVLGWVAFWSGLAQEMLYPLLPVFVVVALGGSRATLGGIEGTLAVGVTVSRLVSARLLHRGASPKRLTRVSYTMSLAARPLMALAPGLGAVAALRIADGLGKGGKDAPRDTLVAADLASTELGRGFGVQRALDTLGSVAGPAVAGALLLWWGRGAGSLRLVFACAALPGLAALVTLRRAHDHRPPPPMVDRAHEPLPRPFVVLLVAVTVFGLANSSDTLLLLRASASGLTTAQVAFAYAAFNLVYAALAIPAGRLSDRIGRRPLLIVAWSTYALVYLGFALTDTSWAIVGLFLAYGIFYATAEGTLKAWVATLVPDHDRGRAYGYFAAASGLLVLPASVLAGALWDEYGPSAAFLTGSALAVIAVAIIIASPALRRYVLPSDVTAA
jgi:MFS family permease